jgi:hypothetical protein
VKHSQHEAGVAVERAKRKDGKTVTSTGGATKPPLPQEAKMSKPIHTSFRAAFVTCAFTALSVTFLTSLAEHDAARAVSSDTARARPLATPIPVPPQSGAVRIIDLRRSPAVETAVQPTRSAKRDRGAA